MGGVRGGVESLLDASEIQEGCYNPNPLGLYIRLVDIGWSTTREVLSSAV